MRVGQRIRELRESRRMGLREMAALLSVTHPTLSKYESGKAKIDADLLPRFAEVLGVSPCAFFEEGEAVAEPAVELVAQRAAEAAVAKAEERVEQRIREAVREELRALLAEVRHATEESVSYEPTAVDRRFRELMQGWPDLPESEQRQIWGIVEERKRLRERGGEHESEPGGQQRG